MGYQEQGNAHFVRFHRSHFGVLLGEWRQLDDGFNDEEKFIFVIVMKKHSAGRQRLGRFGLGFGLASEFCFDRNAPLDSFDSFGSSFFVSSAIDVSIRSWTLYITGGPCAAMKLRIDYPYVAAGAIDCRGDERHERRRRGCRHRSGRRGRIGDVGEIAEASSCGV